MKHFWKWILLAVLITGALLEVLNDNRPDEIATTNYEEALAEKNLSKNIMGNLGYGPAKKVKSDLRYKKKVKVVKQAAKTDRAKRLLEDRFRRKLHDLKNRKKISKKRNRLKKKRKKKKKKKKVVRGKKIRLKKRPKNEETPQEEIIPDVASQTGGGAVGGIPVSQPRGENELETAEDWLEFLGPSPKEKMIDKMITAVRHGKIEIGVLIEVSATYLDEDSEKGHLGAIRAIGTMKNDTSFIMLAKARNEDYSRKTKDRASQYLKEYLNIKNIKALTLVLGRDDADRATKILALSHAERAAKNAERDGGIILALDENQQDFTHTSAQNLDLLRETLDIMSRNPDDAKLSRRARDLRNHIDDIFQG